MSNNSLDLPTGKRTFWYRFFEIFPGLISYGILALLVILSIFQPTWAAFYIIFLIALMLFRAVGIAYHSILGRRKMLRAEAIDWHDRLNDLEHPATALENANDEHIKYEDERTHAENLKKIRKDKGYTQEILAEKLNVVRQTVSKWEKGLSLPDVDMLSKIANVLETDVNILLDGQITTTDQSEIVKQLAKINEQLTIKNRRYKKIMKTIAIILLIIVIFGILLVILNIGTFISISNSETTTTVETMIKEVVR